VRRHPRLSRVGARLRCSSVVTPLCICCGNMNQLTVRSDKERERERRISARRTPPPSTPPTRCFESRGGRLHCALRLAHSLCASDGGRELFQNKNFFRWQPRFEGSFDQLLLLKSAELLGRNGGGQCGRNRWGGARVKVVKYMNGERGVIFHKSETTTRFFLGVGTTCVTTGL